MKISKRLFGTLSDGTEVNCWTLDSENGLLAEVLDYGVTLRSLLVPDRDGNAVDVVLGYDTLEEYISHDDYLGATVGRFANRIKGAAFELNGERHVLYANNGSNHLHGGRRGFDKYVWAAEPQRSALVFSRLSPNGEEGYPGNLLVRVSLGWEGRSLCIRYEAQSDRDTPVNLTNHSYFNLNGAGSGDINGHMMEIHAEHYTPNAADCTPTGDILPVAGSAMDFRRPKPIGRDAGNDEDCVRFFNGYDSNFVLSGHPAVITVGDRSGITMVTDTDQPGLQLYTANVLSDRIGKGGRVYGFRSGFCLETQHYPDCIHHPEWPSCILRAGDVFRSETSYTFL